MPRHIPQRSCIVCSLKTDKRNLFRIVRAPDGSIEADPDGRLPGRGAYLCRSDDCWERALAGGRLARSLAVAVDDQVRERLLQLRSAFQRESIPVSTAAGSGAEPTAKG